jgi:hypothetical protein
MLPEDALLEIFDWDLNRDIFRESEGRIPRRLEGWIPRKFEGWQKLVHVCRKWRSVVLGSPRRLNLRLFCIDTKPVRKMLDMWPPLPIIISGYSAITGDNVVAALERNDRVCKIAIGYIPSPLW